MDMIDLEIVESSLESVSINEEGSIVLVVDIGDLCFVGSSPE
jgi:hypothetical protein